MRQRPLPPLLGLLFLIMASSALGSGKPAPEWRISEWINGEGTSLAELRGKVVVIDFFQLWCPGCNSFSGPLMRRWEEKYRHQIEQQGKLILIGIHTVFEGHNYQTPERLRRYLKEKEIHHLIGIDHHQPGKEIPETMKRFQTRGTPEMAIIDRQGIVRLQKFGSFSPVMGEQLIDRLLAELGA
ncbi:TlpA family protein disulfide reductase [endosymbiont of Ridgeia piscesae]|jgi:thiol-disulfide isomerase/thioredoxin|uniref:Thiol-disulfide isomerase or thioredoxin n=1 Tax=endosymbiont of Ridgeia piscesae TaxID=54398 RepID=A0A0T5Z2R2_9GAMM|nr:TlpA disulfide reductase family protein [endosymbiont of Ridgeia piscesae]KRT55054.1 Thiol-disulfide isomerase or thioredoxin [endosymbiont of Ridgeia piscesae]KRT57083.1 Thiol-disulfide isomerase or thioredoxin [endosymbiont of Ridgeia piscesae]